MESSYGVANITYGLSPSPCRACPSGTEAKASWPKSAKYLAYRGFTSERACVNKPGALLQEGLGHRLGAPQEGAGHRLGAQQERQCT
jgi:hypothetical protein